MVHILTRGRSPTRAASAGRGSTAPPSTAIADPRVQERERACRGRPVKAAPTQGPAGSGSRGSGALPWVSLGPALHGERSGTWGSAGSGSRGSSVCAPGSPWSGLAQRAPWVPQLAGHEIVYTGKKISRYLIFILDSDCISVSGTPGQVCPFDECSEDIVSATFMLKAIFLT